jgi:hypothetical protein
MNRLAENHGFRWVHKTKRFLGIHRGIVVDMYEWDSEVTFKFSSPTVSLGDEPVEQFNGFHHCDEGGLPTSWISYVMERDERGKERCSDQGCAVSIDNRQIDSIGVETFEQIPDLVAQDLHEHGAFETLPCVSCGEKEAATVGLLNYAYSPMCNGCWNDLQLHTSRGKLATEQSVNWLYVIPALAVLTAAGGLIWGFLQQPQLLDNFGFFSMLFPVAWAFGLCWAICFVCGGITRMLRLTLFASVIISVLAGNIWGYRSFAIQQMEKQINQPVIGPGWAESVQLYLAAFPNIWQGEFPFLIGGVLGAWLGLRMLKGAETVDVQ